MLPFYQAVWQGAGDKVPPLTIKQPPGYLGKDAYCNLHVVLVFQCHRCRAPDQFSERISENTDGPSP